MNSEISNPNPMTLRPLTGRQLLAARMFVQGLGSAQVAEAVGATQRTINRWRQLSSFQAELHALHRVAAQAQAQTLAIKRAERSLQEREQQLQNEAARFAKLLLTKSR